MGYNRVAGQLHVAWHRTLAHPQALDVTPITDVLFRRYLRRLRHTSAVTPHRISYLSD